MTDTYDRETSSKRPKTRRLVQKLIKGEVVMIDEDDYLTYKSITSALEFSEDDVEEDSGVHIQIDEDDYQEKHICHLTIEDQKTLPEEVGRLSALKLLDFSYGELQGGLPSSICMLKNLEVLRFTYAGLTELPSEIRNLVNLEELILKGNRIEVLPPSIGDLRSLKKLWLCDTRIRGFPLEFWNLSALQELEVRGAPIVDLSPSIERLKNLESLSIIVEGNLPGEIGNCSRLERLDLEVLDSPLPSEIGNLKRLERLKLRLHDPRLPSSMANLKNLSHFTIVVDDIDDDVLDESHFDFLRKLPKLEVLSILPGLDTKDLLSLVQDIPSLIEITWKDRSPALTRALSRNVYQRRNPFISANGRKLAPALRSKLWPQLLSNATRAFKDSRYFMPMYSNDAVHKLLMDGKESFLEVLVERNKKKARNNEDTMEIDDCCETEDQQTARMTRECLKLAENNPEMRHMFLKDMNKLMEKYGPSV